jgi:hypothetical protein
VKDCAAQPHQNTLKGCQIGQNKLQVRKTSEGTGKEEKERPENPAEAE